MKNIGRYNGIPCYECSHSEYVNAYENKLDDGKQIFIIDGTMVQKNTIVGYYDGKHVKNKYNKQPYYVDDGNVMEFNKQKQATFTADNSKCDEKSVDEVKAKTGTAVAASYEELVKQDIDFRRYSTVVDEFFALLEA